MIPSEPESSKKIKGENHINMGLQHEYRAATEE